MGDKPLMTSRTVRIDEKGSTVIVRTRATGVLARLAHDLEIRSTEVRGSATTEGDSWTAEASLPVASLRVIGARKGDRVDPGVLSADDRAEIERKIREEVFGGKGDIAVRAEGSTRMRGEGAVSIGGSPRGRIRLAQAATEADDGSVSVSGRSEVSLRALGIADVRGPLNAFRVSDTVEVVYNLRMVAEPA